MATDAERLAALGYPLSWCIRALEATGNNLNEAVEYMINYSEFLEEEVREEELNRKSRQVQETVAEEDSWMLNVAKEMGFTQKSLDRDYKTPFNSSSSQEWGFRMMVSPSYSRQVSRELANEPVTRANLDKLLQQVKGFTPAQDAALTTFINEYCAKEGVDPLSLSPATLFPSISKFDDEITRLLPSILVSVSPLNLGLRFVVLRNFNRRLSVALALVDLSRSDAESSLAKKIRSLRAMVFTSVKRTLFERVLSESHTGDGTSMQKDKSPTVVLDRSSTRKEDDEGDSRHKKLNVFGQLFSQVYRKVPLKQLRNSERAFYTILAGEHSDDYGGPYRDALNQACDELMSSGTLFCQCPSKRYVPNPRASSPTAMEMLEFVGVLIGIAMRTKTPLALDMPSIVWKRFCGEQVLFEDVRGCDPGFGNLVDALAKVSNADRAEWMATCGNLDLRFSVNGVDGRIIELVPGGREMSVKYESRKAFQNLAIQKRITEGLSQCSAIARGMATQIPRHLLSLFTWQEVEEMVCGPAIIDIEMLKKCTIYGDGIDERTPVVLYFWKILESFTEEEKRKYLRFVWGRTRLPLTVAEWDRKHKINLLELASDEEEDEINPDGYLPIGHTCFFSIDLPRYSRSEICRNKLSYAITNCVTIDADETTNARRSAEQDRTGVTRVDEATEDLGFD